MDGEREPVLLSIEDLARLLGCSISTVKRLVRLRQLPPGRKVAGQLSRWFREDLDVYLYRLKRGDFDGNSEGQRGSAEASEGQRGSTRSKSE